MVINSVEIKPGQSRQLSLIISKLPTRTPIDIPVHIFRAKKPGPSLLLMAGMHGDEINGVEIIRQMISKKMLKPECGSVVAVPLLNIYGFINFSRQVPDGKDVNRSFPGSKTGSLAGRVAHSFMTEIFPQIDFGVDFHTGGGSISNYPQLRCRLDEPKNRELASAFAPRFIIDSSIRSKSLRGEAAKRGKSILVYEAGEALRLNTAPVQAGIEGTIRLMHYLGMRSDSAPPKQTSIIIKKSSWVRARYAGMFRTQVSIGQKVVKNQVLGSVSDPYGEFEKTVKSPAEGYLIAINHQPVVNQGDALIHVGIEG